MYDYMQELRQRFFREPRCEDLRRTEGDTCGEFLKGMSDEDKCKLLLMVDSDVGRKQKEISGDWSLEISDH